VTRYFIATSWGRTANFWLARVLNSHPDILCAYGPDLAPSKLPGAATTEELNLRHHQDGDRLARMPVDDYFDIMETEGKFKVYGSVHAFFPDKLVAEPTRRAYTLVNLIRHPVERVASLVTWWQWEIGVNRQARLSYQRRFFDTAEEAQVIEARFNVDFTQDPNWLFFNAVMSLGWDRRDFDLGLYQVPMERMTTDRDFFCDLFHRLAGDEVSPEPLFETDLFDQRMNRSTRRSDNVQTIYEAWEPWQKTLFQWAIRQFDLGDAYAELGYEVPAA